MAQEELKIQPVETITPVTPTETPVQASTPFIASSVVPAPQASQVYGASNVQAVSTKSPSSLKSMKIGKLEKELAKANSIAEMNQIGIGNQTVAMGVITGQQAHQSKLDTAKLNALTGMYNVKLADMQRKEAERQQFISTYGADPNARPKGMSEKEFAKSIQSGGFSDLLTEDFKQKQLATKKASQGLSGGGTLTEKTGQIVSDAQNALLSSRGSDGFVSPDTYMNYRSQYATKTGDISGFDSQFAGLLSPAEQQRLGIAMKSTSNLTPAQQTSVADIDSTIQAAQETANLASQVNTGFISGRVGKLGQKVGMASKNFVELNSKIALIKSNFMKAMAGANVTESERKRLEQFLPDTTDSERDIKIKLAGFVNELTRQKENLQIQGGGSGEIRVIDKQTGEVGFIPANEFNSNLYIRP